MDPIKSLLLFQAAEDKTDRYVQKVIITHDNLGILLYLNEQLEYLQGSFKGLQNESLSVIYIDCTYNLTNYYALVTSIKCDLFTGDPLVLGPILLTKRRHAEDYALLLSELEKGFCDHLNQFYIVTDGEEGLVKAVRQMLPNATLLRCAQHLNDNLKRKARELELPSAIITEICKMVKNQYTYGTVTFESQIAEDIRRWEELSKDSACEPKMARFITYFSKYISPVIGENLTSRHSFCGVVTPLTNHAAESVNAVIKKATGEKNSVDHLVMALKEMSGTQSYELKRGFEGTSQKFILKQHEPEVPEDDQPSFSIE